VKIELHIDELVLDGFSRDERPRVQPAVERELARLVGARGLPAAARADAAIDRLDGRAGNLSSDASGDAVGTALARALYGALGR
jgi:hypothetical protein